MRYFITHSLILFSAVAIAALSAPTWANAQGDPFGAGAPGGDPFGGSGGDPFGGGGTTDPSDPFGGGVPGGPAKPEVDLTDDDDSPIAKDTRDPVLKAIRASNPTTPVEIIEAVFFLVDFGAIKEAKEYLKQLQADSPTEEVLLQLYRKFGSGKFVALWKHEAMAPEGTEFAQLVLTAARKDSVAPDRMKAAVAKLAAPSLKTRSEAFAELRAAGRASLPSIINALGDDSQRDAHPFMRQALIQMGKEAVENPLLGVLEAPSEKLRGHAAIVLGELDSVKATPYLVGIFASPKNSEALRYVAGKAIEKSIGTIPTAEDAEAYLYRRALSSYQGELPDNVDPQDNIELWVWDEEKGETVPRKFRYDDASLMVAARISRQLYEIDATKPNYRRLFIATNLEAEKRSVGLDTPISNTNPAHKMATEAGVPAMVDVVDFAIESHRPAAILGVIDVLAVAGDTKLLDGESGRPSSLARALRYGDIRVRFAAANAIMQLDPHSDFPWSGKMVAVLAEAIKTTGNRKALVGHPLQRNAQTLSAFLSQSDFDADSVATGRDVFRLAAGQNDFQVIILSDGIDRPPARELIQQLRRDPRTAGIPIGVMAREENMTYYERLSFDDPLMIAFPPPLDAETMAKRAYEVLRKQGRDIVSPEERIENGRTALRHITKVLDDPRNYPYIDIIEFEKPLIAALYSPDLGQDAAKALGLLATPAAQRALINAASENARTVADRKAAADGFAEAVKRRRILLTKAEMKLQYERYNLARNLPAETQQILGQLLDTIESVTAPKPTGDSAPGDSKADDSKGGDPEAGDAEPAKTTPADPSNAKAG